MKHVTLTLTTDTEFHIPWSTGYSVYAALLSTIDNTAPETATEIHSRDFSTLNNSGLLGTFSKRRANLSKHKTVLTDTEYTIHLGITDPNHDEIFNALFSELFLNNTPIELSHGALTATGFESEETTYGEILTRADNVDANALDFEFVTPTCIRSGENRTTMYPHRVAVFRSLLKKWNAVTPDKHTFDVTNEEIRNTLIEKPHNYELTDHSVLTHRVKRGNEEHTDNGTDEVATDGGTQSPPGTDTDTEESETQQGTESQNRFKQGFTGRVSYKFKGGSEAIRNALTTVALFGNYSGIGLATARGCGYTNIEVDQRG